MQILAPEIWLPARFSFAFRFPALDGRKVWIGSVDSLCDALALLNERTFKVPREQWGGHTREAPVADTPFAQTAVFGLRVFLALAHKAAEHRLPLRLDF
jgi:hypothetical protein